MLKNEDVGQWPMIPAKAFLYFPTGNEIKEGKEEKQWRKIFEDGSPYDDFQNKKLNELDKKLKQERIAPHGWFDRANLLRFLQANKFKVEDTCKSIKEGSQWRQKYFPIQANPEANLKLVLIINQGTLYFCGRDREYRPILVVEITRMKKYSEEIVPVILNKLLEYALEHLLIPGQVENYILIINLDDAGLSDKSSVTRIVSFTSNTYRSRLYASYLLNTPYLIAKGWNAFASAIVSENTLRKIKISQERSHDDMWTHIDKEIVEQKYGGTLPNLQAPYWPPSQKLMNFVSPSNKLKHITKEEYNNLYKSGKLKSRKVKEQLIEKEHMALGTPRRGDINDISQIEMERKSLNSANRIEYTFSPDRRGEEKANPLALLPPSRVRAEQLPPIRKRDFKLFFEDEKFKGLFLH